MLPPFDDEMSLEWCRNCNAFSSWSAAQDIGDAHALTITGSWLQGLHLRITSLLLLLPLLGLPKFLGGQLSSNCLRKAMADLTISSSSCLTVSGSALLFSNPACDPGQRMLSCFCSLPLAMSPRRPSLPEDRHGEHWSAACPAELLHAAEKGQANLT